ncbi:hypothetical protein F4782DRAFT_532153 [Xylaria castorea]|nr:hypothetical protein F4782DRAFT_532153 [Xylaria castorea]
MPIYAINIAEVNVGIVNSCMPVVFVLFKRFTSWSATFLSKIKDITSRRNEPNSRSDASDLRILQYHGIGENELPHPSSGGLTRLRSFIHNINRTKLSAANSSSAASELQTFQSMDYNYHAQLQHSAQLQHNSQLPSSLGKT